MKPADASTRRTATKTKPTNPETSRPTKKLAKEEECKLILSVQYNKILIFLFAFILAVSTTSNASRRIPPKPASSFIPSHRTQSVFSVASGSVADGNQQPGVRINKKAEDAAALASSRLPQPGQSVVSCLFNYQKFHNRGLK